MVFLPFNSKEIELDDSKPNGISAENILFEMRRLRKTEVYVFNITNCCTTGRRILEAASGDNKQLSRWASYKPFGAIDNPQLIHNSAEFMRAEITGKLNPSYKIFPYHISLEETILGIIFNYFIQYETDGSKKNLAKLIATATVLTPAAVISSILTSLYRPTYSLIDSIDIINHFCIKNDAKWFIKAPVLGIFIPRIALIAIPAAIETLITLIVKAITWPFFKAYKLLTKKREDSIERDENKTDRNTKDTDIDSTSNNMPSYANDSNDVDSENSDTSHTSHTSHTSDIESNSHHGQDDTIVSSQTPVFTLYPRLTDPQSNTLDPKEWPPLPTQTKKNC